MVMDPPTMTDSPSPSGTSSSAPLLLASAFSSPTFSTHTWLASLLDTCGSSYVSSELLSRLADFETRLQLTLEDLDDALERECTAVDARLSTDEASRLSVDVETLAVSVQEARTRVAEASDVARNAAGPLPTLLSVARRMEGAAQALESAAGAASLATSANTALLSGNLIRSATLLSSALAPDSVLRALPELALELREAETVADKLRDTARAALRDAFAARDMEGFRNAYQALGIMGEGADGGGTKPAISRDRERTPKYTTPKTSPNPTTISLTSTLAPLLERLRTPTDLASFYVHLLDEMGSFIAFAEEAGIHEDIPAWLSSILTRWLEDEARAPLRRVIATTKESSPSPSSLTHAHLQAAVDAASTWVREAPRVLRLRAITPSSITVLVAAVRPVLEAVALQYAPLEQHVLEAECALHLSGALTDPDQLSPGLANLRRHAEVATERCRAVTGWTAAPSFVKSTDGALSSALRQVNNRLRTAQPDGPRAALTLVRAARRAESCVRSWYRVIRTTTRSTLPILLERARSDELEHMGLFGLALRSEISSFSSVGSDLADLSGLAERVAMLGRGLDRDDVEAVDAVLGESLREARSLAQHAESFAEHLLLKEARAHLKAFCVWPVWQAKGPAGPFAPHPQPWVSALGEHLLALPHVLHETIEDVADAERDLVENEEEHPEDDGVWLRPEGGVADEAAAWLDHLVVTAAKQVLEDALHVPRLTRSGARQLGIDLQHLQSVLRSLQVAVTGDLEIFTNLVTSYGDEEEELRREPAIPQHLLRAFRTMTQGLE